MKKNNIRDYATEAFRFYARRIKIQCADDMHSLSDNALKDIEAVQKVLDEFDTHREPYAVDIIKSVYFVKAEYPLHRLDISNRVIQTAFVYKTNERKVYKILKEARERFAYHRGLRLEN